MRILVTGASGFVGAMLVPRLLAEGHEVRALARDPDRAHRGLASQLLRDRGMFADGDNAPDNVSANLAREMLQLEVLRGDVLLDEGLREALAGVDVAYYLIHSMERADWRSASGAHNGSSFPERERIGATAFGRRAREAGVSRIVYLGGLVPTDWEPSPHLASRMAVERVLLDAVPDSLALRTSIVVGARSRSFALLVRLVERLPVLALPRWSRFATQPIDGRDLVAMLVRAADLEGREQRTIEVAGPEILTYGEMMEGIAEIMLVRRPSLRIGVDMTELSARIVAAIVAEDPELTMSLMGALKGDLLPSSSAQDSADLFGVKLHSFESAVEHALREWETVDPLAAR